MLEFAGLAPLPPGEPAIVVETPGGTYDLHNLAEFVGWQWAAPDLLRFAFAFEPGRWVDPSRELPPARVELEFGGVRELVVEQPADWVPQEAPDFDGVQWWPPARLVVDAGGMRLTFQAAAVSARVR